MLKNYLLAAILKVTDENRRIRIQDPDPNPDPNPNPLVRPWIRGSGSTQKCHGSATPELTHIAMRVETTTEATVGREGRSEAASAAAGAAGDSTARNTDKTDPAWNF